MKKGKLLICTSAVLLACGASLFAINQHKLSVKTLDENVVFGEVSTTSNVSRGIKLITNNATALCSKIGYQVSEEVEGKTSIRFIVAISSSDVTKNYVPDVKASWNIKITKVDSSVSSRSADATNAYLSIKNGSETIYPSSFNEGSYSYNAFITYTLRDIPSTEYKAVVNATCAVSNMSGTSVNTVGISTSVKPTLALIGTQEFDTIPEAFEAAKNTSATIQLVNDVNLVETYPTMWSLIDLTDDTLDLNGHTITAKSCSLNFIGENLTIKNGTFIATNDKNGRNSYAFAIGDEAPTSGVVDDVVCTGGINCYNATVTIKSSTGKTNVTGTYYYSLWSENNAEVTVEDGVFNQPTKQVQPGKVYAHEVIQAAPDNSNQIPGTIIVKGGTFNVDTSSDSSACLTNINRDVTLMGGTYTVEPDNCIIMAGYHTETFEEGTKTLYKVAKDVASFGTQTFQTLEQAIEAAGEDEDSNTITVLVDVDFSEDYGYQDYNELILTNDTLDLGGNSIKSICAGVVYCGTNITIKNGSFVNVPTTGTSDQTYGIHVGDGLENESAVIDDVVSLSGINFCATSAVIKSTTGKTHFKGGKYYAVWADEDNTSVEIQGGLFEQGEKAILGAYDGKLDGHPHAGSITVKGGTFLTNKTDPVASDLILQASIDVGNVHLYGGSYDFDVETAGLLESGYVATYNSTTGLWDVTQEN